MSKDTTVELEQDATDEIGAYVHVFKKLFEYQFTFYCQSLLYLAPG